MELFAFFFPGPEYSVPLRIVPIAVFPVLLFVFFIEPLHFVEQFLVASKARQMFGIGFPLL